MFLRIFGRTEGKTISQIKLKEGFLKKPSLKYGAKCCKHTLISIPSHINLYQEEIMDLFEQRVRNA